MPADATPDASALDPKHVSLLWATQAHADDMARCHAALFPDAWSVESFQQFLAHPGSICLVARYGKPKQQTVGFIVGQLAADEAEIITFGVDAPWQRKGLGRLLLDAFRRAAERGGAKRIHLEVADDNGAALALYGSVGFAEVGRRKGYCKRGSGAAVDAIRLALAGG